MGVLTLVLAFLAAIPQDSKEGLLGPQTVNVRKAAFYKGPSRLSGILREARYGEPVTVTAIPERSSYVKVLLDEGGEAYIAASALIARDEFKPEAADEAEMGKLKAQGYEAGRFDPDTEKKYREQKGPAMDAAYQQVDALEARSLGSGDRAELERLLLEFRRAGRLGEFANVR